MTIVVDSLAAAAAIVLLSFCFPSKAQAYLDPGTGSYFLQIVLAFLLGAMFTLKIYWKKFLAIFSKKSKEKMEDE